MFTLWRVVVREGEHRFGHHLRCMRLGAIATQSRSAAEGVAPVDRSSRNSAGWRSTVVEVELGNEGHRSKAGWEEEDPVVVPSMLFLRMGGGRECGGGGR